MYFLPKSLVYGEPASVHGKKKYAVGHMDQLLRKDAGPHQKLPVGTLDQMLSFTESLQGERVVDFCKGGRGYG